ncbi:MAG: hypothetical protein E6767_01190 [Dysgonomonas sp.]|nr:hypothetical protein [Dysgonomonas sp.]
MNKSTLLTSALLVLILSFLSCEKDDKGSSEYTEIKGYWLTTERSFKSDDSEFDKRINKIFQLDSENYLVMRSFSAIEPESGLGRIATYIEHEDTGSKDRERRGDYHVVADTLYVNDEKVGNTKSKIVLEKNLLLTTTKLTRKEIVPIYVEMGGHESYVPEGIEGVLYTRETREE